MGERKVRYRDCDNFDKLGMPDKPDLWGWGDYYSTEKPLEQLFIEVAKSSIQKSNLPVNEVDALFLCSANFSALQKSHANFIRHVLEETGVDDDTLVTGFTLDGCSSFLSAIVQAQASIVAGTHQNVLVISADYIQPHQLRFRPYALFSDGAAACLVTMANQHHRIEIISSASASRTSMMSDDAPYCEELAQIANNKALLTAGLNNEEIGKVFCGNLFLPLTILKESESGFDEEKIYTNNIQLKGHCFASDPIINLCDAMESEILMDREFVLLAADSPGIRTSIIARIREH